LNTGEDRKKNAFSIETFNVNGSNPTTIFGPDTHPYIENNIFHIEVPSRNGVVIQF